jgi:hypothetical protein
MPGATNTPTALATDISGTRFRSWDFRNAHPRVATLNFQMLCLDIKKAKKFLV